MQHVDEVEDAVEDSHEQVSGTQVHQEVVGDGAHASVSCGDKGEDFLGSRGLSTILARVTTSHLVI